MALGPARPARLLYGAGAAGRYLGGNMASKVEDRAALAALEKRIRKLAPPQE
jgi:hypothetical protein